MKKQKKLFWFGPFQFTNETPKEELFRIYNAALNGSAYWSEGFLYPKSDYTSAYQKAFKILQDVHNLTPEQIFDGVSEAADEQPAAKACKMKKPRN